MRNPTVAALGPLVVVSVLLAVPLAAGCDDDGDVAPGAAADPIDGGGAPTSAEPQAFCDAYGLDRGLDPDADTGARVRTLRDQAGTLAEVGTPDDIPARGRDGFVAYVAASSTATDEEADALAAAGSSVEEVAAAFDVSEDDAGLLVAFQRYVNATCFTTESR